MMKRREFLQLASACSLSACVPTLAREPIGRSGPPRFQVGLAAYSLRDYFFFSRGKSHPPTDPAKGIDMKGFLDYCVAHDLDTAELTSYFFDPDADDDYFLDLKRYAYERGLTISGTAIGNNFTIDPGPQLDQEIANAIAWIDRASLLGAPHIRFFAGTRKQLDGHPERMEQACEALNHCAKHAASKGVFLGVENHGALTPEQLLEIMKRADSPWIGVSLDTGNFATEDPYGDLEKCIGFAVNVQVKVNMRTPDGKKYPADMPRIGKILKDANYQGFVILEYEEDEPHADIPPALQGLKEALA